MYYISHLVVGKFLPDENVNLEIKKVTVGQPFWIHCPKHEQSFNVKYKWEYQQAWSMSHSHPVIVILWVRMEHCIFHLWNQKTSRISTVFQAFIVHVNSKRVSMDKKGP